MDNLLLELEKALEFQQSEFCKETLILTVMEENKKMEEELTLLFA